MKMCLEVESLRIRSIQIRGGPWQIVLEHTVQHCSAHTCSQRSCCLVPLAVHSLIT